MKIISLILFLLIIAPSLKSKEAIDIKQYLENLTLIEKPQISVFVELIKNRNFADVYSMFVPEFKKIMPKNEFMLKIENSWELEKIDIVKSYGFSEFTIYVLHTVEKNGREESSGYHLLVWRKAKENTEEGFLNFPFSISGLPPDFGLLSLMFE